MIYTYENRIDKINKKRRLNHYETYRTEKLDRHRYHFLFYIVLLSCLALGSVQADEETGNHAELYNILRTQKELAEGNAAILKENKERDIKNYMIGMQIYNDARADFAGLIEHIQYILRNRNQIQNPEKFKATLRAAIIKSNALDQHVKGKITGDTSESRKRSANQNSRLGDPFSTAMNVAADLFKYFDQKRRIDLKTELNTLENLQWEKFHSIGIK